MTIGNKTVAEKRNYSIIDVQSAKEVALVWLKKMRVENARGFGLPITKLNRKWI